MTALNADLVRGCADELKVRVTGAALQQLVEHVLDVCIDNLDVLQSYIAADRASNHHETADDRAAAELSAGELYGQLLDLAPAELDLTPQDAIATARNLRMARHRKPVAA